MTPEARMVPTARDRCRLPWLILTCTLLAVLAGSGRPARAGGADDPSSISREQFATLVERAPHDARALAALRRVRTVDGRPVDLTAALSGATGRATQTRLRALARLVGSSRSTPSGPGPAAASASSASSAKARREAARVLARDKFRRKSVPRPFRGILRWIGDRLAPVVDPVARFVAKVLTSGAGQLGLLTLIVAAAAFVAHRLAGGRSRAAALRAAHRRSRLVDPGADPDALDRRAVAAEEAGRHAEAVRLRYQAGLVRLDRNGAIHLRPETTTRDVAQRVASPVLDQLTVTFDEIVYGGRLAGPADSAAARDGWVAVLATPALR